jgi:hypothetical protein
MEAGDAMERGEQRAPLLPEVMLQRSLPFARKPHPRLTAKIFHIMVT